MKAYKLIITYYASNEEHKKDMSITRYFAQKEVAEQVSLELQNFYNKKQFEIFEQSVYLHQYYLFLKRKESIDNFIFKGEIEDFINFISKWPEDQRYLLVLGFLCGGLKSKLEEIEIED